MLKALKEVNPSLERCCHVNNLEAAVDGFAIYLFFPDGVRVKVAGDGDGLGSDLSHLAELVFCREGLVLGPLLEVAEHEFLILLDVVDQYSFLGGVAVPVLGLVLVVAEGVL